MLPPMVGHATMVSNAYLVCELLKYSVIHVFREGIKYSWNLVIRRILGAHCITKSILTTFESHLRLRAISDYIAKY